MCDISQRNLHGLQRPSISKAIAGTTRVHQRGYPLSLSVSLSLLSLALSPMCPNLSESKGEELSCVVLDRCSQRTKHTQMPNIRTCLTHISVQGVSIL